MKKIGFIYSLLLFSIVGCSEDDAWNVKKNKKDKAERDSYLTVSEFITIDEKIYGFHRAAIMSDRNLDHAIHMQIDIVRRDPLCNDLNTGKLSTYKTIEYKWQLCDGYNSAHTVYWAEQGTKRIELDSIFIEKTINENEEL